MRFLLTGGTLNPLKPDYLDVLSRLGHTAEVLYPGEPRPDTSVYDALLLPGGGDIDPSRFMAPLLANGSEVLDAPRDELEFTIFDEFFRAGKPILGICRGLQVINVALGGSIWQDLPSQRGLIHAAPEGCPPLTHKVIFTDGDTESVNSYHHQAVNHLGRGLLVTARSPDGVVEALEHDTLPIRAVQWHPEKGCFRMTYLLEALHTND